MNVKLLKVLTILILFSVLFIPASAIYVQCVNGSAATLNINWTFTGAPGTDALVTNIGDEYNALLDITIPAGVAGADGGGVDTSQFLFINGTRVMTGNLQMGTNRITGLGDPNADTDAATQGYVLDQVAGSSNYNGSYDDLIRSDYVYTDNESYPLTDGSRTLTGIWDFGGFNASNLADPISAQDAATKAFVEVAVSGASNYNETYDLKPNSTFNETYDANLDTSEFYLVNTSRALTGNTIKRDVNNSEVSLYGGDGLAGSGAVFSVMGKDYGSPGAIFAYVSDAAGDGYSSLFHATGATDNPELSMDSNMIVDLVTGTTGDTATNKTYVDTAISGVSATNVSQFPFLNGSRMLTGVWNFGGFNASNISDPVSAQDAMTLNYLLSNPSLTMNQTPNMTPGDQGIPGLAASISINNTITLAAGEDATVINVGNESVAELDFGIPQGLMNQTPGEKGDQGDPGLAATITVNATFTGDAGTEAIVANVGNTTVAEFDFTIPQGLMNQTPGTNGTSPTIVVNYTSTLAAGESATVANVGNETSVELDFGIPQGGTGETGAAGINGTSVTLAINYTFTLDSGEPANVTNIGNETSIELDFGIPQGLMNQTPGVAGETGATGGTGGQVLFFHHDPVEEPAGYEGLFPIPAGTTEADETVVVQTGTGEVLVDPYITIAGYPGITTLPAGLWRFRTFHYVSGASGDTNAVFKVYNRSGVTETLLFTATSDDINALSATEYLTSYVQTEDYTVALTDRIVIRVYGQSDHSANINFHFVYEGTDHTSHVQTPLETSSSLYIRTDGSVDFTGDQSMGEHQITNLITGTGGDTATNKTYVDSVVTTYNESYNDLIRTDYVYTDNETYVLTGNDSYVLTSNDTYVLTNNDTYVKNPLSGHLTLMAGSAMITTTLPGHMNQWETTTNKNNFIYLNFSDGGTETAQWIVDFPADWNSTANVWFAPIWTAQDGSGTIKFDISGKLFTNDDALDTALSAIGSSTDTLIATGDLHIAPDTTGAAISAVSSGGNTAIIKAARDSASDTLSGTGQLIGLRIKYIRTLA